jgi:hypothetical protein
MSQDQNFASADVETPEDDLELEVNDDRNLDVDTPSDDETEDTTGAPADGAAKPAKATRPKAPEGFVKPVEFAKLLSDHLHSQGRLAADKSVAPQVVYSYIKNNSGEGARNPFPVHQVEGDTYPWYIVPQEGLDWWDAKNNRVTASKEQRAAKAAAKAAKPAAGEAEPVGEVTEAE